MLSTWVWIRNFMNVVEQNLPFEMQFSWGVTEQWKGQHWSLFVIKGRQTWEKLEALQHLPLLAEIHHQVTHVVTSFRLQGESKGRSHCHAADSETHRKTTQTHGVDTRAAYYSTEPEEEKQIILVLITNKRPLTRFLSLPLNSSPWSPLRKQS